MDTPIRFNRKTGKVYVYEAGWSVNAFSRKPWPQEIKEFDWNTLQAEIVRMRGFNGKSYVEHNALIVASCKPGTQEVVANASPAST